MQQVVERDQSVVDEVERTKWKRTLETLAKDWRLYVLLIPMLLFLVLFKYLPIGGLLTGFKWGDDKSILYNGEWAGIYWAQYIFTGPYSTTFWTAFRNTFVNSMYGLILGFPIPIFLALLFSEIKCMGYRSFLQVASYLPHFVSTVVVTTIIGLWCEGTTVSNPNGGVLYMLCKALGMCYTKDGNVIASTLLEQPKFFRPIYQVSGIWEGAGYGSIVYFAAILAISPTSYEAARIDGASKLQQIRYITFPGMAPTLTIMLIMRIGHILNVGYEKVILLIGDKQAAWETGDVVSSFVYRMSGKAGENFNGAVISQVGIVADLFNSILAMVLVLGANAISRRVSSTSLF
ncbi:MAG: ABC transporter permease subunit [Anaeroplasmataceae bacterium]|nr:ABC transporter permease subunit [Anaeroplasmataceae bacterium]